MNEEVKRVFALKPMISFRSSRKLSNYLVRAKIHPIGRSTGSFKCGKKINAARYAKVSIKLKILLLQLPIPINFAKFTGKHLCWSLFFNKSGGLVPFLYLLKTSENLFAMPQKVL